MQKDPKEVVVKWNILKILQWTTSYFESHNIDTPRITAQILLAHALGIEQIDLYIRYDQPLNKCELSIFRSLIKRRIKREPVAYITGTVGFWGIELSVSPYVLIPRPDTETIVETVMGIMANLPANKSDKDKVSILELGTGSGAIILSLASENLKGSFTATDCSVNAIELAYKNAVNCGLSNCVNFIAGNWFSPITIETKFDIIISNPPYIPTNHISSLQLEIAMYEPILALDGGSGGLDCLRKIIFDAPSHLKRGGYLILEIGHDQGEAVTEIIKQTGFYINLEIIKDYTGNDRVVKVVMDAELCDGL